MAKVAAFDPFNPKKIYEDLIARCKKAKAYYIRCIIDESFVGYSPFPTIIQDGVYIFKVIDNNRRDAFLQVANKLPVVKFLDDVNAPE